MKGLLFFASFASAFYVVEFCKDEVQEGVMKACMNCDSTVYYESCGHVERKDDIIDALSFANQRDRIRGFKFVGLYNTTSISLRTVIKDKTRIVQVDKEETYQEEVLEL